MGGTRKWFIEGFCVAGAHCSGCRWPAPELRARVGTPGQKRRSSGNSSGAGGCCRSWRGVRTARQSLSLREGSSGQADLRPCIGTSGRSFDRSNSPKMCFGTRAPFRVDLKRRTIIHHVQYASISAWEGGDQLRAFKLRGSRLTLSASPAEPGGVTAVLKWKKVSGPPTLRAAGADECRKRVDW